MVSGDFLPDDQIDDAQPTADVASGDEDTGLGVRHVQRFRDLVGFWVLGLTNNFAYVQVSWCTKMIISLVSSFVTTLILDAERSRGYPRGHPRVWHWYYSSCRHLAYFVGTLCVGRLRPSPTWNTTRPLLSNTHTLSLYSTRI